MHVCDRERGRPKIEKSVRKREDKEKRESDQRRVERKKVGKAMWISVVIK